MALLWKIKKKDDPLKIRTVTDNDGILISFTGDGLRKPYGWVCIKFGSHDTPELVNVAKNFLGQPSLLWLHVYMCSATGLPIAFSRLILHWTLPHVWLSTRHWYINKIQQKRSWIYLLKKLSLLFCLLRPLVTWQNYSHFSPRIFPVKHISILKPTLAVTCMVPALANFDFLGGIFSCCRWEKLYWNNKIPACCFGYLLPKK